MTSRLDDMLAQVDRMADRVDALCAARHDAEFNEADHPRGQAENAGQFGPGGGSHTKPAEGGGKDRKATGGASKPLGKSHKEALQRYTLAGSYPINDFLRNGTAVEKGKYANASSIRSQADLKKVVRDLDQAFSQASLDKETTVFRGVNEDAWKKIQKQAAAGEVEDKGFVSTTTDRKSVTGSSLTHWMKITVPKGAKAIPLGGDIANRTKNEILLDRGTKFRVIKLTRSGVELEVVA